VVAARTIRVIPQAAGRLVERSGRYSRTLEPGPDDRHAVHRSREAARRSAEQVVNFSPQSVITED